MSPRGWATDPYFWNIPKPAYIFGFFIFKLKKEKKRVSHAWDFFAGLAARQRMDNARMVAVAAQYMFELAAQKAMSFSSVEFFKI